MRTRSLILAAAALLSLVILSGCGVARKLTTRHKTFTYTVDLPPAPANTMAHGQYTLDEEVQNTYNKYHGGVDETRLAYRARNSSAAQPATLKLYVSVNGSLSSSQLEEQATLVETIALTPSEERTVPLATAPNNAPLRAFLADVLSRTSVTAVHFYAATTSADPIAVVTVQDFTTQVEVHGSYF
jgi:hypothetical protein